MPDNDNTIEDLLLNAGILFFKHNKKSDILEFDYEKCHKIFPHLNEVPKLNCGKMFYRNIIHKDRLLLKSYIINNNNNKNKNKNINFFRPHHVDIRYLNKSSNEILWLRVQILDSRKGKLNQFRYGSIQNITNDKSQLLKTTHIAYTDDLTGLINREKMKQKISLAIGTTRSCDLTHSVIAINIDYLSTINSMFGYQITNDLIEEIANTILANKRDTDIIARISSGKFIILLVNTQNANLEAIGQRFLNVIRNTNFKTRSGIISVTASGAGCHIPNDANTCDDVFAVLEECLTKAKKRGRDNFVKYSSDIHKETLYKENITLSEKIIHAIQMNRIHTAYQPIIHRDTPEKSFMECLARIQDMDGSYIPAYKFIPIAENIGFIKHIDLKLCENALKDLAQYPHLKLSINISGHTLYSLSHNSMLMNLLSHYTHVSKRLCLELTETIPLQDIENISSIFKHIKSMGYKIALDDFGAGYNSFSNLSELDFDIVKIDGSYIKNISKNPKSQIFTQVLTDLAKKLNIEIVAEIIDNEDDLNFIKKLGIDYYQGYYFAQPSLNFDDMNNITYGLNSKDLTKKII